MTQETVTVETEDGTVAIGGEIAYASDVTFVVSFADDAAGGSMTYRGHVHGENVSVPYDTAERRKDGTWTIGGEVWRGNSDTFTWQSPGSGWGLLGFVTGTPIEDFSLEVNGFAVPADGLAPYVPPGGYGGGGYGN